MKIRVDSLDVLFSQFIRMRANGCCERCGHIYQDTTKENGDILLAWQQFQCCHFISRRNKAVRFDPDNCVSLCFGCHQYFHEHHNEFEAFMIQRLGQQGFDLLNCRARIPARYVDKKLLEIYFTNQIELLDKGGRRW